MPTFSEVETQILRSTRRVCPECKGECRVIVRRPFRMYQCGYADFCVICPTCNGFGTVEPNAKRPAASTDHKCAAAGEIA